MSQPLTGLERRPRLLVRVAITWLAIVACVVVLVYVLASVARQIVNPPPPLRLVLVRDVPLPSGLGATSVGTSDPLAPGVTVPFDTFDFQAYDPQTRLLFIAHTGPSPAKLDLAHIKYDPATDGHIIVFNTERQSVVGRVNIPRVSGIVVAADLHRVFAADAGDNTLYAIDENTLATTPIPLGNNEKPDAVSYDPVDHRIVVSDLGAPANPNTTSNIDPNNQNLVIVDAVTEHIIAKINIGNMPKLVGEQAPTVKGSDVPLFGYRLGHNAYDSAQHHVFLTTQILPDGNSPNPNVLPPPGTGELMEIDPITATVIHRTQLPATCITPHGLTIDTAQEVAFIVCTQVDPAHNIAPNLARVDLRTMCVIPADPQAMRLAPSPDIAVLDGAAHVLLVGCKQGISVFDERAGAFHKLGDYQMGPNTHSILVDEATQYIYLPMNVGGRPVLRIVRYNASGA